MATALEYGLLAALSAVAAITAISTWEPEEKPVVAMCTTKSITGSGTVQLSCPNQPRGLQLHLTSSTLAIAQAVRSRPMSCSLHTNREAACRLDL